MAFRILSNLNLLRSRSAVRLQGTGTDFGIEMMFSISGGADVVW